MLVAALGVAYSYMCAPCKAGIRFHLPTWRVKKCMNTSKRKSLHRLQEPLFKARPMGLQILCKLNVSAVNMQCSERKRTCNKFLRRAK